MGNNSHVTCDSIYFFAVSHKFITNNPHCYLHDDEPLKDITNTIINLNLSKK